MTKTAFSEERDIKNEKLIQSQNIERVYLNESESVVHVYNDKSFIDPNELANFSSLKSQIEINTDETSPKISWGMKEHLHVQSGYAHTDLPSTLLQSRSAHLIYYNK